MSKNYLAYLFLVLAALFWSGNFIVGKFATLFEIPPMSLNVLRWISAWIILIPFTYKEILQNLAYIMFLFFKEGPRIGRKSGSVGLKPSHSSS